MQLFLPPPSGALPVAGALEIAAGESKEGELAESRSKIEITYDLAEQQ